MVKRRERVGFPLETNQPLRVAGEDVRQNLDRHVTAKFRVPSAIHFTHSAGTQRRQNFVGSKPCACSEGHRCLDYKPSQTFWGYCSVAEVLGNYRRSALLFAKLTVC